MKNVAAETTRSTGMAASRRRMTKGRTPVTARDAPAFHVPGSKFRGVPGLPGLNEPHRGTRNPERGTNLSFDRDVLQDRDDQPRRLPPLDVWLHQDGRGAVEERDPGGVLEDQGLRLPVGAIAYLAVSLRAGALEQGVDLRVVVLRLVVLAVRGEVDVQEVLRIGVVRLPAERPHLVLAPAHI